MDLQIILVKPHVIAPLLSHHPSHDAIILTFPIGRQACVDAVKALPWVKSVDVRLAVEYRGKKRQDPKAQV